MSAYIPSAYYDGEPLAGHVIDRIQGANWWPVDAGQIASAERSAEVAISASIDRFLRRVRWAPFIVDVSEETRFFNRIDEQGRIWLGDGLMSLSSVIIQGRNYAIGQTAFGEPTNALAKEQPYTCIRLWGNSLGFGFGGDGLGDGCGGLRRPIELRPESIAVKGHWGRVRRWPADAREAVIGVAAGLTLASVNQESELSSVSEDGFAEAYDLVGPIDQKTALLNWGKNFDPVAASYAKPAPGAQTVSTSAYVVTRVHGFGSSL